MAKRTTQLTPTPKKNTHAPTTKTQKPTIDGESTQQAVDIKTVVRPVQNAMAILRYLVEVDGPSTATMIARALKINTSTCFNILRTLAGEGMIVFDPVGKTYRLGFELLKLAANVATEESRLTAARPHLHDFAGDHQVTICVWRRMSSDRNVLVASEHLPGNLRIHLHVGQRLPVLLGSTGRVMAPRLGLTKARVRAAFNKMRWFDAPSFEQFWADAMEAQTRGWAFDSGNFAAGVLTVSAPIISPSGQVSYSLTAMAFRDQHNNESIQRLGADLVQLSNKLCSIMY